MLSQTIVAGSLSAIAKQNNQSLAETLLDAEIAVIVDCSSSMSDRDSRNGQTRHETARAELARLQMAHPGKIAVISFGNSRTAQFCPSGVLPEPYGSTDLAGALAFAKVLDSTMPFAIVSDGEPDSEEAALNVARTIESTISVIYCGPEGGHGSAFLARLAKAHGGQSLLAEHADKLCDKLETLLLQAGN